MAGPFMMFLETFPALRHLDFLFGNTIKRIKTLSDETNGYLEEVSHVQPDDKKNILNLLKLHSFLRYLNNHSFLQAIKTTESSFNADNQPSCYVEAFLIEQKKRKESGKDEG